MTRGTRPEGRGGQPPQNMRVYPDGREAGRLAEVANCPGLRSLSSQHAQPQGPTLSALPSPGAVPTLTPVAPSWGGGALTPGPAPSTQHNGIAACTGGMSVSHGLSIRPYEGTPHPKDSSG